MAKNDLHMQRVRERILQIQKDKELRESKRRLREEKRFAVKVQAANEERKRKEKRNLMEAVKKHRKGMKAQLEMMLNNAATLQSSDSETENSDKRHAVMGKKTNKMSRVMRNKKFGYGGQKKISKKNDKER